MAWIVLRSPSALAALFLLLPGVPARATSFGPVDLGTASGFAVFTLSGKFELTNSQTTVEGDIALGPGAQQGFSEGTIHGTFFVDPTRGQHEVEQRGLRRRHDDGRSLPDHRRRTRRRGHGRRARCDPDLRGHRPPITIQSTAAVNVISVGKIKLDGSEALALQGGAGDVFIINGSDLVLSGTAKIDLLGGITADHVLFNLTNEYVQSGDSLVNGTVLCVSSVGCTKPARNNGAFLNGALFAEAVNLTSGSQITPPPHSTAVPEPTAALVFAAGAIVVASVSRRSS